MGELLAGLDVELAGGEEGDFLDRDDELGAPEGGQAVIEELVA